MGDFRIVIEAIGGHGCDRKAKEGEPLKDCGSESCPDCFARAFVSKLRKTSTVYNAKLTHWPVHIDHPSAAKYEDNGSNNIVDDLLDGKRLKGHF